MIINKVCKEESDMKKTVVKVLTFFAVVIGVCIGEKMSVEAHTTGGLVYSGDGTQYLCDTNFKRVTNDFVFDGRYTYYAQADGTPMKNRLTYHPDGEHIIYFDTQGHEVFSKFQYCESVGYTCYFDSQGYIYKDQLTFVDRVPYYLNANGKMEDSGWFQFANGLDYGYADSNGVLINNKFANDNQGRVVYYHWNGMAARGLISDGLWYYSMDINDGHYLGRFKAAGVAPSDTYQLQVLDLVNQERLSRNIAPLKLNTDVQQVAQLRASEICTSFSHTRPDGRSCFTALDDAGISNMTAGENIAAGYRTPEEVMEGWMNSPGHRANILDTDYTEMGIGYYTNASSEYGSYWVQMFIGDYDKSYN